MKRTALIVMALGLALTAAARADEVRFARFPELSPDGRRIAFSYDGDIWTVPVAGGDAKRVTDHVEWDGYPVWSPDGRRIAFASSRHGGGDVFVVDAEGGEAERLTWDSSTDIPSDWTPDGSSILFFSRRLGAEDLFVVRVSGGTPIRISGVEFEREAYADLSNDGTKLVYNNNRCTSGWHRRFFDSSDAADVYVADFSVSGIRSRPLTEDTHHDLWPHFGPGDKEVFFVSGRAGALNIYRMPAGRGEGESRPMTSFETDVTWLSVSETGLLAFQTGFDVYTMPGDGGTPSKVTIRCPTEFKENPVRVETFAGDVTEFRVSPDGKKTAVVVHGEVFVVPSEKGGAARRVTRTPWRESDVRWLDDSRRIVYTSDRNGNLDLFTADTKTGEETLLVGGSENDCRPAPSPDGAWIAFYRGNHAIGRVKPEGGTPEVLIRAKFLDLRLESEESFAWSPDSKWIAYSSYAADFHTDIRVRNLEDGTDEPVSYLATNNYRPVWSPDGKYLYFTSQFQENGDTYRVLLKEEKPEFEEDVLDSLYEDGEKGEGGEEEKKEEEKKKEKKEGGEEKEDEKKAPEPVVIDFEDIMQRVRAFPDLANDESEPVFVEGGDKVVFSANVMGPGSHDLWSYPAKTAEETKLEQLTTSGAEKSGLQAVSDAVWYLESGRVKWYDVGKSKSGSLTFHADMEIDERADREQMFQEAWSLLDDQFYDPAFHGADWARIRKEYAAVVPHARNKADFHTLIRMMIGELSASHLDIWDPKARVPRETGYLGVELDYPLTARGVFRVRSVLPEGPATLEESKIETGEYILSVDGETLGTDVNFDRLLEGKIGKRVELTVAEDEGGKNGRTVRIKPVSRGEYVGLVEDGWERERRRLVDEWSGGRLAYLWIRGMGGGDLERFRRELVNIAEEKEGAVIDVRYNGGGWISVHLLGILDREPFLLRNFRGEPFTREAKMRSYAYGKPTALLIHNHSYSNAEIFAEGWRKLGLGPIVGTPTAGSVIGTGGWTLIDGTVFRKPSWGAFTLEGENLENNGRKPDYEVHNEYNDWIEGRDPQLKKAVDLLMVDLEKK
ncbi:MAG: S41 family peptidase [Candidatus Eisenbacteria bacterium]